MSWARNQFDVARTTTCNAFACKHCDFVIYVRKGMSGVGCGYGWRSENAATSSMIQHVKSEHADQRNEVQA